MWRIDFRSTIRDARRAWRRLRVWRGARRFGVLRHDDAPSARPSASRSIRDASLCVNLNQCDLHCVMCWTTSDRARKRTFSAPLNMPRDELVALLRSPELRDLRSISVVGGGEPFVYPFLEDLLREAPTATRRLMIMTHGGLLQRRPAFWEIAREANLTLTFSVDAACEDTYASIRRGGTWSTLLQNIERYAALRAANPRLGLNASFVVLERNLDEVIPFLQMCAAWSAEYVHFHPAIAGSYPERWRVDRTGARYLRTMEAAYEFARRHAIELDRPEELLTSPELLRQRNPASDGRAEVLDPRRSCRLHSEAMTISHRGEVYVCDTAFRLPYSCGNVLRDGVQGAWESVAWRSLREAHRQGRPDEHPLCARCLLIR